MNIVRNFALVLLLATSLYAQAPASPANDDTIWKQYYTWLQEGDPHTKTPQAYRASIIAGGLTEAQADERMSLLQRLSAQHQSDLVALFFDRIYAAPSTLYTTEPNAFLVNVTAGMTPGAALDVAMGQGRNALYLASKGWQVTGFDIAEKGLDAAQTEAAKRGLHITTVKSLTEEFDFGHEKWDLIVLTYAWAPITDPAFVSRVRDGLNPRGLVVIEQPAEDPSTPHDPTDEVNVLLRSWAPGFRILHYEDTEGQWDWRIRKARVLRLLAQK